MNCCSCFTFERRKVHNKSGESDNKSGESDDGDLPDAFTLPHNDQNEAVNNNFVQVQTFTFRELAAATKNFRQETLLGEGGFGRVYKGQLAKLKKTAAVKQLDRNGMQGNKEFLAEVLRISQLHHPNLVNLIGYCADGDQRLLVYEFMPLGSLEDHLLDLQPEDTPLDWFKRMKIALGAAKGLECLHDQANPPVIFRDLKSSNVLLDKEYNVKLSDFGLATLGPQGDKTQATVMGTYGYCSPEYQRTGQLTLMSDIYSFGVVLLEIITGRRAMDPTRPINEQNLVSWAEPYFKDPSRFPELADPLLEGNYPVKSLNQVVAIASMCLQDEATVRPLISDVGIALSFLCQSPEQLNLAPIQPAADPPPQQHPDTVLVPPQPALAPTYDIAPQPVLTPVKERTSPPVEQILVQRQVSGSATPRKIRALSRNLPHNCTIDLVPPPAPAPYPSPTEGVPPPSLPLPHPLFVDPVSSLAPIKTGRKQTRALAVPQPALSNHQVPLESTPAIASPEPSIPSQATPAPTQAAQTLSQPPLVDLVSLNPAQDFIQETPAQDVTLHQPSQIDQVPPQLTPSEPAQATLALSQTTTIIDLPRSPLVDVFPSDPVLNPSQKDFSPMHNDDQGRNVMDIDGSKTNLGVSQNSQSLWTTPSIIV